MVTYLSIKLNIYMKYTSKIIVLTVFIVAIFVGFTTTKIASLRFTKYVMPNSYVGSINISNLSKDDTKKLIKNNLSVPNTISFVFNDQKFSINSTDISLNYDYEDIINEIFSNQDKINNSFLSMVTYLFKKHHYLPSISFDSEKFDKYLIDIASAITVDPVYPKVIWVEGSIYISDTHPGTKFNKDEFIKEFESKIIDSNSDTFNITLENIDPSLSDEEKNHLITSAKSILKNNITLKFDNKDFKIIKDTDLLELLDIDTRDKKRFVINKSNLSTLIADLAKTLDRPVQNPVFIFKDSKVEEFKPAKNGISIDVLKLEDLVVNSLQDLEKTSVSVNIPYTSIQPDYQTSDINSMGIKDLLGTGESFYKGSISGRMYNINLAASHFNGVLIPPGNTISFNDILGDVSGYTGYKQAYVIKDGKTVLGDGGGVCQVSSTLFRAALSAGLPILERHAHSYRVSYYEQGFGPGLDATVYSPTSDLKIKNDTPAHLLIQVENDPAKHHLLFEIYGTSDGRISTVSKPVISQVSSPPDDLYVDDPSLPSGTIKQIEHKALGAKVSFTYQVDKNGEVLYQKTFVSNYKPWQAVFLKGTAPM